jgi:phosphoadenosine phosphosulfate reductase
MKTTEIEQLSAELGTAKPKDIIRKAFSLFDNIAISFSGAEDVVLIEMATKISKKVNVFTLDTGRLHPETYRYLEKVRDHYQLQLDTLSPDSQNLESFVKNKGLFSFFRDGHSECCGIRKVEPLRKKLSTLDAWITGQRRDQSPSTRNSVAVVEADLSNGLAEHPLVKFNPLANWSSEDVWNYIRMFEVPYNELHNHGFISIGCEPCTRAVLPNQHEREGRWWWEEATQKECGLHIRNRDNT